MYTISNKTIIVFKTYITLDVRARVSESKLVDFCLCVKHVVLCLSQLNVSDC